MRRVTKRTFSGRSLSSSSSSSSSASLASSSTSPASSASNFTSSASSSSSSLSYYSSSTSSSALLPSAPPTPRTGPLPTNSKQPSSSASAAQPSPPPPTPTQQEQQQQPQQQQPLPPPPPPCRICHGPDPAPPTSCSCRGTHGRIHASCLRAWISSRLARGMPLDVAGLCELCGHSFVPSDQLAAIYKSHLLLHSSSSAAGDLLGTPAATSLLPPLPLARTARAAAVAITTHSFLSPSTTSPSPTTLRDGLVHELQRHRQRQQQRRQEGQQHQQQPYLMTNHPYDSSSHDDAISLLADIDDPQLRRRIQRYHNRQVAINSNAANRNAAGDGRGRLAVTSTIGWGWRVALRALYVAAAAMAAARCVRRARKGAAAAVAVAHYVFMAVLDARGLWMLLRRVWTRAT